MTNQEIATAWRGLVESPYTWKPSPNQAGAIEGEATGVYVYADEFPRRAYLKPASEKPDDAQYCRGAREKIAADLAHDLGLPVPPAVLTTYQERPAVVSLVMYPRQWSWEHVRSLDVSKPGLVEAAVAAQMPVAAAMLAFDTWLGQMDHGDHNPHNIIWGFTPRDHADSRLIFLDYAFSMGFDGCLWADRKWEKVKRAIFPDLLTAALDPDILSDAVERIEQLSEKHIGAVVQRVPDLWMPADQRNMVEEALSFRRKMLRPCLL